MVVYTFPKKLSYPRWYRAGELPMDMYKSSAWTPDSPFKRLHLPLECHLPWSHCSAALTCFEAHAELCDSCECTWHTSCTVFHIGYTKFVNLLIARTGLFCSRKPWLLGRATSFVWMSRLYSLQSGLWHPCNCAPVVITLRLVIPRSIDTLVTFACTIAMVANWGLLLHHCICLK